MTYTIHQTNQPPRYRGEWNDEIWQRAGIAQIAAFHPQSSAFRPNAEVKALHDDANLYVMFRVQDQFIRATYTTYQDPVYRDSCVEFFVMPRSPERGAAGYFNVEMNCLGTMLLYYIEDAKRTAQGFEKFTKVPQERLRGMTVFHSISAPLQEELTSPLEWVVEYNLPLSLFEAYLGELHPAAGLRWRGNFFKCGDDTSQPHWASWSPIGEALNFHQPDKFGVLEFA